MRLNRIGSSIAAIAMVLTLAQTVFAEEENLTVGNPHNGLSSEAFLRNTLTTNPKSLQLLRGSALSNGLLTDPYLALQLHDPRARAVMEELVECALDRNTEVSYVDPFTKISHTWRGELGLCQHSGTEEGDWTLGPPSEACQELVTACVMARVNGLGESIPLSLRGQPSPLFPLRKAVQIDTRFRESPAGEDPSEGQLIGSFSGPLCFKGHECDWAPAYVGTCNPGQVQLAIQDPAVCGSTPLRVCAGIHGCLGPSSGWTPPADFLRFPYSKLIKDQRGACTGAPLVFTCPTETPFGGHYSVMVKHTPATRPDRSGAAIPLTPILQQRTPNIVKLAGSGTYPAKETEVFSFLEGAFYGNLFEPGALTRSCEVDITGSGYVLCAPLDGTTLPQACKRGYFYNIGVPFISALCPEPTINVPYQNVYACYSLAQEEDSKLDQVSVAYLNSRICDLPNGSCFPHTPTRCYYKDPEVNQQKGAHCSWLSHEGVFQGCQGGGSPLKTYRPITTYLNDPCDLIGGGELCNRVRRSIGLSAGRSSGDLLAASPGPRGCGGCSSDGADGPLRSASLAAVLALLLCRRRPRRAGGSDAS